MTWFNRLLGSTQTPRLAGIYIATSASAPMRSVASVEAMANEGLEGDRYATGGGYWRAIEACQITLIGADHLAAASRRSGLALGNGEHRRNLVIEGLSQNDLRNATLRIGEVCLCWQRVRPPCGYLDQIAGRGMARALGRLSGHCFRITQGGRLRVGDAVEFIH